MLFKTLKLVTAMSALLLGVAGTSATSNAEPRNQRIGGMNSGNSVGVRVGVNRPVNRIGNNRQRNFNGNFDNNRRGNWDGNRRGNWANNRGYWNNGRYSRRQSTGIYLSLGDGGGGCGYAYRKWQNSGSRYWRSRYYNCVG